MRKATIIALLAIIIVSLSISKEKLFINFKNGNSYGMTISKIDSISFSEDSAVTFFELTDTTTTFINSDIDSISFEDFSNLVNIKYSENRVYIINPFAYEGVNISFDGSKVVVNSTYPEVVKYVLSGNSTDGLFKIYSNTKFEVELNDLSLSNQTGPALNFQSKQSSKVYLMGSNYIFDGQTYSEAPLNSDGEQEDQTAAFYAESELIFQGDGKLTIKGIGNKKHALASKDKIEVISGEITIESAVKDGIHTNRELSIKGGVLSITATGDAIDGDAGVITIESGIISTNNISKDVKSISCDGDLSILGGEIKVNLSGDQSKGLKSKGNILIAGGSIEFLTSGNAVLEAVDSGYDPSYCTAIKSDADVIITGGKIYINSTGIAGKGISADNDILIQGGEITIATSGNGEKYTNSTGVTDVYNATCITADRNIIIESGSIDLNSTGSASKGISSDGILTIGTSNLIPNVNVTTKGSKITISGSGNNADYAESKTIKSDGDIIINNGNINISSADDGIKSDKSIVINSGNITISNSTEGIEAPFITFNDGIINVTASDDALNSTMGNDIEGNDGSLITINGGTIFLDASKGDAIDSNGDVKMTGGIVIAHGPPSQPEVGIDVNGSFLISGGLLAVSGISSNMTEGASTNSTQYSFLIKSSSIISSSTLIHIEDENGQNLLTFQPKRNYSSIVFSSPNLVNGSNYKIYTGGNSTGTNTNGYYTGGIYSGGTLKKTITISNKVSNISM